jgi:hypothetical protein
LDKFFIIIFCVFISFSCSQKLRTLSDGSTKVTDKPSSYKSISKFNKEIFAEIDTSVIYKEIYFIQDLDSSTLGLNKLKKYRTTYLPDNSRRRFYRFYANGYVNCFINLVDTKISLENFNPDSTGFRGVFYRKKNGKICIELFQPVTGYGKYGINKEFITFAGDSMFIKQDKNSVSSTVFIKTKMNEDLSKVKKWTR